ncbi:uncharacterized protein TRUGW13939_10442 [Talaromyces rugulosus]|uniref:GPI anchored cell wall protein n=1 Tax=Talaromyces rugulosus TaxID=121627 RepID=A0A7H8RFG0_TALRU|nr:uncharacterized protein TRUGW13939_10442 [Talaromyces rugulosus]QKX63273.1 hypothetical protein TRUGW13939_10442 [Talaromyces rugulosus]
MARRYLFLTTLVAAKTISATTAAAPVTTTAEGASTTQIQLYVIGETQSVPQFTGMAGSIVDANSVATTIAVECTDDAAGCGNLSGPITAIQGPSTRGGTFVVKTETNGIEATMTVENSCQITGATQSASCAETIKINGEAGGQKASSTMSTTIQAKSNGITLEPLLITAGLEKLNSPQATETPGAAPAPVTGNMGLTLGGAAAGAVAAVAALL